MYWCSSAESEKLVPSVVDAYEKIKRAGPNPIKTENVEPQKKAKKVLTTPIG